MTKPFHGNVRNEWFQNPEQVTFTFYVKDRVESDVRVECTATSLSVTIKLDASGREYLYNIDNLYAPIRISSPPPRVDVRGMKIEVTVQKETPQQWPMLEALEGDVVLANMPATSKELSYPNSRGKDWNAVKLEVEEEKPEGDHALNALFKKIYGDGTDEQRRAMMKSFVESNGTVLSTNWEDVGKREVKTESPKGMEPKTYSS